MLVQQLRNIANDKSVNERKVITHKSGKLTYDFQSHTIKMVHEDYMY